MIKRVTVFVLMSIVVGAGPSKVWALEDKYEAKRFIECNEELEDMGKEKPLPKASLLTTAEIATENIDGGVTEISFFTIQGYKYGTRFKSEELRQSDEIKNLHSELNGILENIAAVFGEKFQDMFASGVYVSFKAAPLGPVDSRESSQGVFEDWSPKEGLLSKVAFAHEMAHNLSKEPQRYGLPKVLSELDNFYTFHEFFPDWVAYKATGKIDLDVSGLPALRTRNYVESYDLPTESFSTNQVDRTMLEWLIAIKQKKQKTSQEERLMKFMVDETELNRRLELVNRNYYDENLLETSMNIRLLDPHALSMPVFMLFRDIEIKIGRSLNEELIKALKTLDESKFTDRTFDVDIVDYKKDIRVVVKTPRHLLEEFRKQLGPQERIVFDKLCKSRKIEEGLTLEENTIMEGYVRALALEQFKTQNPSFRGLYRMRRNPEFIIRKVSRFWR